MYRISGRGGKGITAMIVNDRNGRLVASFPVEESDQIMLVTDGGKLIRCPVDDVRIAGRSVQGVRIFKTDDDEKVVSVERIPEDGNGEAESRERRRTRCLAVIPASGVSSRAGTQCHQLRARLCSSWVPDIRLREFRDDRLAYLAFFIASNENTKSCLSSGLWQVKQFFSTALSLTVLSALNA